MMKIEKLIEKYEDENRRILNSRPDLSLRGDFSPEGFRLLFISELLDDLKSIDNDLIIDDFILDKAIDTWGIDAQLEMVIEECIELALALQKLKRRRGDMTEKEAAVIDEIADVKIMIRQAEKIFGLERVNLRVSFKMNRLKERLNDKMP